MSHTTVRENKATVTENKSHTTERAMQPLYRRLVSDATVTGRWM